MPFLTANERALVRALKGQHPTASNTALADLAATRGVLITEQAIGKMFRNAPPEPPTTEATAAEDSAKTLEFCVQLLATIAEDQCLRTTHRVAARKHLAKLRRIAAGELVDETEAAD